MKKTIMKTAAIIGAVTSAFFILYLLKDCIKGCPFCGKSSETEEKYTQDEAPDDFDIPVAEEKPEKRSNSQKVRRGYIPLKFHTKEINA